MNILIIANHFNPGGISKYILNLSRALALRGHKVFIASSAGSWQDRLIKNNVEHINIPLGTKSILSPKIFLSYRILKAIIKEKHIDIIHSNTRVSSALAYWLTRKLSVPFVTTAHGFYRVGIGRRMFPYWGVKVIAISKEVKGHLINDFKLKADNVVLIHNGIDTSCRPLAQAAKEELKNKFALNAGPVIGIVARLSEVKGHKYLIEAFARIVKEVPSAQLFSIGGGRIKRSLELLAEKLGVGSCVRFIDSLPDTSEALSVMDVFVMPSISEGLGLSLMEAMLYNIPVAASAVGGIMSLIENEKTGLLVKPKDPQALAAAILVLLKDKEKSRRLSANAREFILKEFSLDKMVCLTEQVYSQCIEQPKDIQGGNIV